MDQKNSPAGVAPKPGHEVRQNANSDSDFTDNSTKMQQFNLMQFSCDAYAQNGWRMVPIAPGSKGPQTAGWNQKENCIGDGQLVPPGYGIGLAHAYSNTMAFDIDNWDQTKVFLMLHGVDLGALYDALNAITIESGVNGHGKLLFALPSRFQLPTKRVTFKNLQGLTKTVCEFRCTTKDGTTVQDVLPPTIHPITNQPYQWGGRGHWENLPPIPMELYNIWLKLVQQDDAPEVQSRPSTPFDATWEKVINAVNCIDPDLGRDEWLKVGMGLHQHGHDTNQLELAFTTWNNWSRGSKIKYGGQREMLSIWRSFNPGGGVNIATVFQVAKQHGYVISERDITPVDVEKMFQGATRVTRAKGSTTFSHRELMQRQLLEVAFLVAGLLTQGVYILGGKPKVGKSWLALYLLICVAYGLPVFGSLAVTKGLALYISLEDHDRRLWKRVKQVFHDKPTDDLHFATQWPRIGEGCVEQLDEWLTAHPGTKLVIIDTLARVKPPRGKSGDIYAEDYAAVSAFKELSENHSITVILVHHLRKMTSDDPADMLSGTTGLAGGVDGTLILIKPRNTKTLTLHRSGRDLSDDEPLSLDWDKETGDWRTLDAGEAAIQYLTDEQQFIMEILRTSNVPMSRRDIAERAAYEQEAIKRPMDALMKKGLLTKEGPYHSPFYSIKKNTPHGD